MTAPAFQSASAGAPASDPSREYTRRLEQREARAAALRLRTVRLAQARLGAFALAALVAAGAWWSGAWSGWLALAPLAGFAALVVVHLRSREALERVERAVAFYRGGLARIAYQSGGERWTQSDFAAADHPYAEHLDLFGPGSLFARICQAQTRGGAERLAAWLLAPAEPAAIRARQQAAQELRERLELREDRAVAAPLRPGGLGADWLIAWGREAPPAPSPVLRAGLAALSVLAALAIAWACAGGGWSAFLGVGALELALYAGLRARVGHVSGVLERPARELERLAELLARFEREPLVAPQLRALRERSQGGGARTPSAEIARLRRLCELLELRRNQLFAPLGAALLWGTQCSLAIEAWCAEHGPRLGAWFDVLFELEALSDLGGYAYENPADPFPELAEGGPLLEADNLGHPLLSPVRAVRNSLALGPERVLYVVSGSNMSGKSTWLRAIGSNAVLALAGAPVRAQRLRIAPLWVGASIRVQDSLEEGISRFYAEIRGLARVASLAAERPLLFLLDEILAGTNSHDRGIGAAALVRAFLDKGAIGLLTTHDLALARIADELAPRAANVHFEDQLADGEVSFDYRVREGVVTRSNALALMRAIGLDV